MCLFSTVHAPGERGIASPSLHTDKQKLVMYKGQAHTYSTDFLEKSFAYGPDSLSLRKLWEASPGGRWMRARSLPDYQLLTIPGGATPN